MKRKRIPLLCKIFGHHFNKKNDLSNTPLKRKRIVFRCQRCDEVMVTRKQGKRRVSY